MEIINRAKGHSDGEMVSFGRPPSGLQDELNHRTHKAGYTDRDGQPMIRKISSTNVKSTLSDIEAYRKGYDKIDWTIKE